MRQRRWLKLLSDYDCEIRYHSGEENIVTGAIRRKGRAKPLRVRALVMIINSNLPPQIHEAQVETLKKDLRMRTFMVWSRSLKLVSMKLSALGAGVGYHALET
ncbi:hypothetical protein Tco_1537160 [Tanacetum coccineum]